MQQQVKRYSGILDAGALLQLVNMFLIICLFSCKAKQPLPNTLFQKLEPTQTHIN
jgi:hypothetical protein